MQRPPPTVPVERVRPAAWTWTLASLARAAERWSSDGPVTVRDQVHMVIMIARAARRCQRTRAFGRRPSLDSRVESTPRAEPCGFRLGVPVGRVDHAVTPTGWARLGRQKSLRRVQLGPGSRHTS